MTADLSADVLVVGAGLAGGAGAIEAVSHGASVLLADAGAASSPRAQGGIAAAVGEDDEPALHERDTLLAGSGICDVAAVRSLTTEARAAVRWLSSHGVVFDQAADGCFALATEAAHSRPRVLHAHGDATGDRVMAALEGELGALERARPPRLRRLRRARLRCLLRLGDTAVGACLVTAGRPLLVRAAATVLATGGFAGRYQRTTNARLSDGYGLAAALAAGAALADLEFVQFHPTAFAGDGPCFLVTEALRGAGAWLTDLAGRRFLAEVDPRGELAPRSAVARAIADHLGRTGEPHVLLDARHLGEARLRTEFPAFLARCAQVGLHPLHQPVPVAPAAHYTMGGIVTDLWGRTGVPGLLAAGECARTGVHGANRLASNSLLEAVVFGRRAGRAAVWRAGGGASGASPGAPTPAPAPVLHDDRDRVRHVLARQVGLVRDRRGLEGAARALEPGSLPHLVAQAALVREESRGSHVRADYPDEVAAWAPREVVISAPAAGAAAGAPVVEVRERGLGSQEKGA